ncbi:Pre-mRNA-splicing factor SPF27 [Dioszegia hungarica]|uniref:Pre-mRNA-splicing factor SPF27 n=1 Tax=Dioszegia hungarica TaxID=4972 RepID=A0AA38LWI3_9TREE|nr:Pre-mRNA-splicing factor SPF27 [Dioszegia hungarica]KAI9636689.1 Pre-mRNA-splicing factor SPF27 [Dioszegia hungarica]
MASSSNIDALPYYDKQVEVPGEFPASAKAAAQALIEAELRQTPQIASDDPRLPPDVAVFPKSAGLTQLLENYESHPIRGIDASKYAPPSAAEGASLEDLVAAERQGRIGEGHMDLRNDNISVLSNYGPNAYLVRNYQLNSQLTELNSVLGDLKEQVTEVNRKRRVFQEDTGVHLGKLESRWQDLISSTVQLEMACRAMDGEVKGLRRKEEELRTEVADLEAQQ